MAQTKVDPLHHVRGVPSETLATLTGCAKYDKIDAVIAEWYNWLIDQYEMMGRYFDNWQQAWHAFVEAQPEKGFRAA